MSVPQLVMNCFAPLITHLPLRDSARVLVAPASDPASGSVSPNAHNFLPARSRDTCLESPAVQESVQNPLQQSLHDYTEALHIAAGIKDLDGPNVNPLCHTRLYSQGHRVERSLVLLHGFTNCPQQMDSLGKLFYQRGRNVFIP